MPYPKENKKLSPKRKIPQLAPYLYVGERGPLPKLITPTEMKLLGSQLRTLDETAVAIGMSRAAFHARIKEAPELREAWEEGRRGTFATLRMRQIQVALSPTHPQAAMMLVHLGKTLLGQNEKHQHEHTGAGGGPIRYAEIRRVIIQADSERFEFETGPVIEHQEPETSEAPEADGEADDHE
jgi:hypothetical protein